ncbi:MAG TPA: 50S ribosomal protein L3 [Syntrophorhabdaceae bacterium]|jgi:large subunit ribosomal protein L3|nr:MAG: 50S ribosomal protein L3 [Deltaproteobacteria bacterium ADurb.Bin026]HNQ63038.1 50S ribosomal protein L3 [Syntrophorhabdaceae bacterium]HNZ58609.1 50S ribosomal protein L3 [Syntrophorhabdaceae bacterium]HOB68672.1 50S ribosomal protein L3 [Syntrophorhabdaceae bacterium]HOG39433.1 50S ribosomal protein L3 [Syntrophorhabdaceae bacterium]
MGLGILGKKLGMTQIFREDGSIVPATVIQAGPCYVVQKKTNEKEGYTAIQLGFEEVKKVNRINKPLVGHFKKANIPPTRILKEFRVGPEEVDANEVGSQISVERFEIGDYVDITGTSKGKGFAGVMKRYGFGGSPASHGTHEYFRHGGSIGQNMTPGRTLKGKKMPGHMGNSRVTVQNLKVVEVRSDNNILLVEGAIPGPNNGYVIINKAVKKNK